MSQANRNTPWLLWPFVALWELVAGIIKITGRLLAVVLGVVVMVVGIALSLTLIGAIIGVPLVILGFTMVVRGLF